MKSRFKSINTDIEGVVEIERKPIADHRGLFTRFFCTKEFKELSFIETIQQINQTITNKKGSIRGMHLQLSPNEDHKIVSCLKGRVFDVFVDIRKKSPTFLQWRSIILDSDKVNSVLIPPGVAHGFQTLEDNCEMLYMHSAFYNPQSELTVNAFDKKINISWPLDMTDISEKDKNSQIINNSFQGL